MSSQQEEWSQNRGRTMEQLAQCQTNLVKPFQVIGNSFQLFSNVNREKVPTAPEADQRLIYEYRYAIDS